MKFYLVIMHGRPFALRHEGSTLTAGFYRNVYVWARSEQHAVESAKAKVRSDLLENSAVSGIDGQEIEFDADEVEPSMALWRSFLPQGFIFYPVDDEVSD